ncbi:hypothetical protein DEJ05_06040 [Curtobacterium sp. MCLR17_045]|nr:hypothetical protein DEJ05_06040 [Curtobacterium sp. MCLR17_045]
MPTEASAGRRWMRAVRKADIEAAHAHLESLGAQPARDGVDASIWARDFGRRVRWLNARLRRMDYQFIPYELVLKSKGAKKSPREISRPRFQDRMVLRLMARHLSGIDSSARGRLAQDVVGCVISELNSQRFDYYLKIDIRDFYPSLSHDWVRAVLSRVLVNPDLVNLYMSAIRTPSVSRGASGLDCDDERKGVPQGLAISNAVAELSLVHLDDEIRGIDGLAYFRFVDDILVLLTEDSSKTLIPRVSGALGRAGLTIHPVEAGSGKSAVGALSTHFEFLGYRFEGARVTVKKSGVGRMEERLSRAFTAYKYALVRANGSPRLEAVARARLQWHVNLAITGCRFDGHTVGWLAFYSQIRHHQLLEHLDWMIGTKAKRFGAGDLEFKSFVRAYRFVASKKIDGTGYIPDFDNWTVDQKRTALVEVFGVDPRRIRDDVEVEGRFRARVRKEVLELERDAGDGYRR